MDITDEELRSELRKYGVNAAVTSSTRSVLLKRLEKLRKEKNPQQQLKRQSSHENLSVTAPLTKGTGKRQTRASLGATKLFPASSSVSASSEEDELQQDSTILSSRSSRSRASIAKPSDISNNNITVDLQSPSEKSFDRGNSIIPGLRKDQKPPPQTSKAAPPSAPSSNAGPPPQTRRRRSGSPDIIPPSPPRGSPPLSSYSTSSSKNPRVFLFSSSGEKDETVPTPPPISFQAKSATSKATANAASTNRTATRQSTAFGILCRLQPVKKTEFLSHSTESPLKFSDSESYDEESDGAGEEFSRRIDDGIAVFTPSSFGTRGTTSYGTPGGYPSSYGTPGYTSEERVYTRLRDTFKTPVSTIPSPSSMVIPQKPGRSPAFMTPAGTGSGFTPGFESRTAITGAFPFNNGDLSTRRTTPSWFSSLNSFGQKLKESISPGRATKNGSLLQHNNTDQPAQFGAKPSLWSARNGNGAAGDADFIYSDDLDEVPAKNWVTDSNIYWGIIGFLLFIGISYLVTVHSEKVWLAMDVTASAAADTADFVYRHMILPLVISVIVVGGVVGAYVFQRNRWHKQAEEQREVYEMVESIINTIRDHHEQCVKDGVKDPFLAIPHVRDMLIPASKKKQMQAIWEKAVQYLKANESRLREESQFISGEEFMVWRWLQTAAASPGKGWQGLAFPEEQMPLNMPPYPPTECLKARGMFDPSKETDVDWPESVRREILQKVGPEPKILHISVDRISPEGRVYLKCATRDDAGLVYKALHGSWFNGHLVCVKYIPPKRYVERFPEAANAKLPLQLY